MKENLMETIQKGIFLRPFLKIPVQIRYRLGLLKPGCRLTGSQVKLGKIMPGVLIYALFFLIYNLTVMTILSLKNVPSNILLKTVMFELVLITLALLIFFIIRFFLKTQSEQEKLRFEQEKVTLQMEHSNRLLKTLASEQREFRNRLQVMYIFAETGKNGELSKYIQSVATKMNETKMLDIGNPIIAAAIMSQKILGTEKGIETMVYSNTPLNDFTIDVIKLGETLNVILGLFVENEVLSRSATKMVFMDIKEEDSCYHFQFDNSEEAARNFRSGKYKDYKLPCALKYREEGVEKFKRVKELIKDLNGEASYIVKGGYVVQLSFKLQKKRGNN
jgi:hypothetical protein